MAPQEKREIRGIRIVSCEKKPQGFWLPVGELHSLRLKQELDQGWLARGLSKSRIQQGERMDLHFIGGPEKAGGSLNGNRGDLNFRGDGHRLPEAGLWGEGNKGGRRD